VALNTLIDSVLLRRSGGHCILESLLSSSLMDTLACDAWIVLMSVPCLSLYHGLVSQVLTSLAKSNHWWRQPLFDTANVSHMFSGLYIN
jgi:hypothetical protein